MKQVEIFFEQNPEAKECFVALGVVKPTREEAEKLLGGISGQAVSVFSRGTEVPVTDEVEDLYDQLAAQQATAEAARLKFETAPDFSRKDAETAWLAEADKVKAIEAKIQADEKNSAS